MLIENYTTEWVRLTCGSETGMPDLVIHLERDISEVIPYLNSVFGGFQYTREPRSVSFRLNGKLVVVHPREICVSSPGQGPEGEKITQWLREKINDTWERREEIEPRFEGPASPKVLEILKLLPMTNCGLCGLQTCMVFASQAAKGQKNPDDCPPLEGERKAKLVTYLGQFDL